MPLYRSETSRWLDRQGSFLNRAARPVPHDDSFSPNARVYQACQYGATELSLWG